MSVTSQPRGDDVFETQIRRPRHRHRHSARPARSALQVLQPGGQLHLASLRRHGPGARHQQAAGRNAGRRDRRATARPARARRSISRSSRRRRRCRAAGLSARAASRSWPASGCCSSTTTRPISRSSASLADAVGRRGPRDHATPDEALEWIRRGDPLRRGAAGHADAGAWTALTLARSLRKHRSAESLPLILLTSMGQLTDAAATDCSATLLKPIKPSALFDALLTVLAKDSARSRAAVTGEAVRSRRWASACRCGSCWRRTTS